MTRPLVLASASPRRKELLIRCGWPDFTVEPSRAGELEPGSVPASALALENAGLKAFDVATRHPEALVIGADTLIELENRTIGKPENEHDAVRILLALAGKSHFVTTGVCLHCAAAALTVRFAVSTEVVFRPFDRATAAEYVRLVNTLDKAGAYAVQEHGEMIVERICGSYDNVVGLPTERLGEALEAAFAALS